jgi:YVTN family beta-propeller protein
MKNNNLIFAILIVLIVAACKKTGLDISPDLNISYPAAYVVNGGDNNISVVDLATNTVKEKIDMGGVTFPHHVYFNKDKTLMSVAIISQDLSGGHSGHGSSLVGGYRILVIGTKTGNLKKDLTTTNLPHNGIFSPDGSELWVGQGADAGQVLVYNVSDFALKSTINVGKLPSEVTFSADGTYAFVANTGDGTVSVIDPTTKTVKSTITVGKAPVGAWAGSNNKMYADNETDQTVSEIDAKTLKVIETISLGFKPGYVAYNDHTSEVWVSDATNGKVVYYKVISGKWTKQGDIVTGSDAHAIAFTANHKTAYVTNQGAATVSVIDVSNHKVTATINVGSKPNGIVLKE